MVEKLQIEILKNTTPPPPVKSVQSSVKEQDKDFHTVFEQFQAVNKIDEPSKDNVQQNHRVQKKQESGEKITESLQHALSRSHFIKAHRLKMMRLKVKDGIKNPPWSQKIGVKKKGNLAQPNPTPTKTAGKRKRYFQHYGVKKGRYVIKRQPGTTKYRIVTTRKKTPPHAEEKQKLSESVRKENVRGLKNAKSRLAKKNSASSTIRKPVDAIPKMVQKQEAGSASKEMIHGERDSALISEKYENNVPKVLSKTDYQIVKNTDEIFDEIVRQFSFIVKKGGGEANIVLQPDILGKLKLNLKLNQHEVHSVIIVDNQSVKDLIISRLNILEQSLLQQGFTLGSFHVEVNDSEAGLNTEEQEIGKALKMSRDIDSDKEAVMNPVVMITPEWLSTIINVTA